MINIIIAGDICPTGKIENTFIEGSVHEIFHDLLDDIGSADLSIVNLECPLISHETPISKAGPVLGASVKCIEGFKAAKWILLNLANNHSYDHGTQGLQETIDVIKGVGLNVVGVGLTTKEAQVPYIAQIKGKRIVIYSMAEREFSCADEEMPGANPLDIINFVYAIREHKQNGIFIVLIHGGKEFYPYPSPEMIRRCRFMIDMGADAVICCHTHCPLPWESYTGRPIVYGLGNLIFEAVNEQPADWHKGYMASLTIDDAGISLRAIPYFQSLSSLGAQKMDDSESEHFFSEMQQKNLQLADSAFIKKRWVKYCQEQKEVYLSELFAYNRLMRKLRQFLLPLLHSDLAILRTLLMVQCETHREILDTLFKEIRRGE